MAKLKLVHVEISTFAGSAINAEHYYGRMCVDEIGNYEDIEIEGPMTQKVATYLNKKDGVRWGNSYAYHKKGGMTNRFDTENEVRERAIQIWKEHFPEADLLLEGNSCHVCPKRALDGPADIVQVLNDIHDKWKRLDDTRIPSEAKKEDSLTNLFMNVLASGDSSRGRKPTCCPKCGEGWGYYTREVVKYKSLGYFHEADPNDLLGEVGDLIRGGDKWYCMSCEKDITKHIAPFI